MQVLITGVALKTRCHSTLAKLVDSMLTPADMNSSNDLLKESISNEVGLGLGCYNIMWRINARLHGQRVVQRGAMEGKDWI